MPQELSFERYRFENDSGKCEGIRYTGVKKFLTLEEVVATPKRRNSLSDFRRDNMSKISVLKRSTSINLT